MVKKRILGAVLLCSCLFAGTAYGTEAVTAQGSNTVILVDGTAQEIYPYNIDGNNYFKLRDMAAVLKISLPLVKYRLSRAKKQLEALLREEEEA